MTEMAILTAEPRASALLMKLTLDGIGTRSGRLERRSHQLALMHMSKFIGKVTVERASSEGNAICQASQRSGGSLPCLLSSAYVSIPQPICQTDVVGCAQLKKALRCSLTIARRSAATF
jgi:hypothetical protein